jgi:Rod binding domain-containing protein
MDATFYPINQTTGPKSYSMAEKPVAEKRTEKLRETAEDFESFFLFQVLELMQPKGLGEDNILSGGFGEEMFRHNMNEEVAKIITKQGGIGIADQIYNELLKHQEVSQ